MENAFNPEPSKPPQEVIFSMKKQVQIHLTISLNNIQVERVSYQKHLDIILDEKLNFKQHTHKIKKCTHSLPRKLLITIYKAFLRPLIDYPGIIDGQSQNESFCEKLEPVQYKDALKIIDAI